MASHFVIAFHYNLDDLPVGLEQVVQRVFDVYDRRAGTFGFYFLVQVADVECLFGGVLGWGLLLDLLFPDHSCSIYNEVYYK